MLGLSVVKDKLVVLTFYFDRSGQRKVSKEALLIGWTTENLPAMVYYHHLGSPTNLIFISTTETLNRNKARAFRAVDIAVDGGLPADRISPTPSKRRICRVCFLGICIILPTFETCAVSCATASHGPLTLLNPGSMPSFPTEVRLPALGLDHRITTEFCDEFTTLRE